MSNVLLVFRLLGAGVQAGSLDCLICCQLYTIRRVGAGYWILPRGVLDQNMVEDLSFRPEVVCYNKIYVILELSVWHDFARASEHETSHLNRSDP